MDPLDIYRENFDERRKEVDERLNSVMAFTRQFIPFNFQELLYDHDDGEFEYPLNWVKVSDPRAVDTTTDLEVLPLLGIWQGNNEVDPGVSHLTLFGKLPNGDEREIGTLRDYDGRHNPEIVINYPSKYDHRAIVELESADAEIFLDLAESALQAQNPQS